MRRFSLLNKALNDYVLMDLSLYTSSEVRDLVVVGTGSTIHLSFDDGPTHLGAWNNQLQTSNASLWESAAPPTDGSGSNVPTVGYMVGVSDSNMSSPAVQSLDLNGAAIGNDLYGDAAAQHADEAVSDVFNIQALDDPSSNGSDDGHAMTQIAYLAPRTSLAFSTVLDGEQIFANGILANMQSAASDALGTVQGNVWQSSMAPFGGPGTVPTAIWIGGEGTFGDQIPSTGLHGAAPTEGGGVTLVAASFGSTALPLALTDLPGLANPVAGSFGASLTDAGIGSSGATAAELLEALDDSGLNVNGTGIKVGVLSDSFNDLGGAAEDEADGALPPAADIQVLKDLASGGTDEGRAMMQIIHDIAPGADLAFYTASDSEQDFADGILALAAAGCKVIVDDVAYFDEPFFQNGVVAQAIQTVEAEGVTYITAAGNDASNGYQAAWTPTSGSFGGVNLTDAESFGGSIVQTIRIVGNSSYDVPLILEWNQAYGAATSDLEILVFSGGQLLGSFTNRSDAEPTNPWVAVDLPGGATYQIAIVNLSGPNPGLIKEIIEGDGLPVTISGANAGTVYGHAMTPGAITVGAVNVVDTPAYGVSPPTSESYSSSGAGTELLFANNGTPLSSPDVLSPVVVSGVDNIQTTVSDLTDFYGTSAAAASLAGVAALILSANPTLTPAQVEQILEETALPMADPAVSGAGLVQVDAAVQAATPTNINVSSFIVAVQQSVAASSFFTISNPLGDNITEYSFEDNGGGSGHFTVAGTVEPDGQAFTVSASNLSSVQYVGGALAGTDALTVDAYDATTGTWVPSVSLSAVTAAPFPFAAASDLTEAMYIGYFGRAADPGGDAFWLNALGSGLSESAMAALFAPQAEATSLYPFLASPSTANQTQITSFIESVYADLFDRAADSGGLAFWDNYLTTNLGNPQAVGTFVFSVITGAAQGSDQTTIANKVTVADYFTQELNAAGVSFTASADALAHSAIASVTAVASTVFAAESTINSWLITQLSTAETALVGVSHISAVSSI